MIPRCGSGSSARQECNVTPPPAESAPRPEEPVTDISHQSEYVARLGDQIGGLGHLPHFGPLLYCTTVAAELQRDWSLPTGEDLGRVFHDHYRSYGLLMDSFEDKTANVVWKAS
jgi:hypothetical protein